MFIRSKYTFWEVVLWTRRESMMFLLYSLLITILYDVVDWKFLQLPWPPIALLGTAVAFIIGFQNSVSYSRLQRARTLLGSLANTCRAFAKNVLSMVGNQDGESNYSKDQVARERQGLIYRQLAWLTALRYKLRQKKPWEVWDTYKTNLEWKRDIHVPEQTSTFDEDVRVYLSETEKEELTRQSNIATALIVMQSEHLTQLNNRGLLWKFSYLELQKQLDSLILLAGQVEGVKNYPYPRHYVTASYYLVWVLVVLLPFAVLPAFDHLDIMLASKHGYSEHSFIWAVVPFCTAISWAFYTMQRIGTLGENPFEGSSIDVPVSSVVRDLEIELRLLLGEDADQLPERFPVKRDVVM